jgi:hypothetical protein
MSYTCPKCRRVSHNPIDERERYCGACNTFAADHSPLAQMFFNEAELRELMGATLERRESLLRIDLSTLKLDPEEMASMGRYIDHKKRVLRSLQTALAEALITVKRTQR